MNRRTYLAAVGVGAGALAGCLGRASEGAPDGIRLAGIDTENTDGAAHTIRVLVNFDGDLVHWSATEVPAFDATEGEPGGGELERTWPDEPGDVTIYARLDDESDWKTQNLGDTIKGPCARVHLSVDRDGALSILFSGCEATTTSA